MTRFDYPDWLPARMMHTADPVHRLYSLLAEMQSLTGAERRPIREARAWKIHHLCHLIDPGACAASLPFRLGEAQVNEIFGAAMRALEGLPDGERPPAMLISAIHGSAASCQPAPSSSRRLHAAAVAL